MVESVDTCSGLGRVGRTETPPGPWRKSSHLSQTKSLDARKAGGKGWTGPHVHQWRGTRTRKYFGRCSGTNRQSLRGWISGSLSGVL